MTSPVGLLLIQSGCSKRQKTAMFIKNPAEQPIGRLVRMLRSDQRDEYLKNELENNFSARSFVHLLSTVFSPHQSGVAERMIRSLLNFCAGNSCSYEDSEISVTQCTMYDLIHKQQSYKRHPAQRLDLASLLEYTAPKSVTFPRVWVKMLIYDSREARRQSRKQK